VLIFESQRNARDATRRLLLALAIPLIALAFLVNGAQAVAWGFTGGFWVAGELLLPRRFLAVNTALVLLFVLGGWWVETPRLASGGGQRLTEQLGARLAQPSGNRGEQRFANTVDEIAIASGLKRARAMVLARDGRINAVAARWSADDAAVAVTQGALDHPTREALQGLVGYGFSHIVAGNTRLNMRPIGMVFGLEMRCRMGQTLSQPSEPNRRLGGVCCAKPRASAATRWPRRSSACC
jgi:heat shock protein HtpX